MTFRGMVCAKVGGLVSLAMALTFGGAAFGQASGGTKPKAGPVDPGVRGGLSGGGGPLKGLTTDETAFFQDGQARFNDVEAVTGGANNGLGPRFNSNQCFSCHAQPDEGGSSPAQNPLIAVATFNGAKNKVPWFITAKGPVREARFVHSPDGTGDGEVHDLFVITGRADAVGCNIAQPDFLPAGNPATGQGGNPNIIFRIPTPVFGAGLIESIPDSAILANMKANATAKSALGISGHANAFLSGNVNRNANDGTISRFGWKAQNKSLLLFASEAYNVEMGVTNQLFTQERDETPGCLFNATPEDTLNFTPAPPSAGGNANTAVISDIEAFANFMRMLAPPAPAPATPATEKGRATFAKVGCVHCHTPSLTTGQKIASGSATRPSAALSSQTANLYSDLIVHHMGGGLADGITQGGAGPDEFRTAPLWGVGQRVFFLHDGRTSNLVEAIREHRGKGSEANRVIEQFERLSVEEQQEVIDFLRAL
ncbi:MAG TPA: di-heme oxidoredictase family protein [Candidatus Sulfotelmatobacter sp.]|nr:di-heme oxidoredictase family protein [Candidatus Sulfotelmatobacter sp.]